MNKSDEFEYSMEMLLLELEIQREVKLRATLDSKHPEVGKSKVRAANIVRAAGLVSMSLAAGRAPRDMPRYSDGTVHTPDKVEWVHRPCSATDK
jgi:hypothetical protein